MLDPQPSVWVLEFLLRQPIEDWLAHELLLELPTPSSLPRSLYITLLLRRLASLLSRRRLSVTLLSSLELLHLLSSRPLPPSLPPAYSASALHLAASRLRCPDPCAFHEIADVFFCRRLGDLENSGMGEGLMSEELKEVKKLVEMAAGGNAEAREDILRRDNEREVVEKVRKCLKEAAEAMGPSFLELAAEAVSGSGLGGALVDVAEKHNGSLASRGDVASNGHKFDLLPTPEVSRVKEALKMSCANLQMVVEDPLRDAVTTAAGVLISMAQEISHKEPRENQDQEEGLVTVSAVEKGAEVTGTEGTSSGVVRNRDQVAGPSTVVLVNSNDPKELLGKQIIENGNGPTCIGDKGAENNNKGTSNGGVEQDKKFTSRSLMDRNPTAHTYEWDDSIDSLPDASPTSSRKLHLPTPKGRIVSPLNLLENKKFVRRRKARKWSLLEEDTLREAVQKHGKGNWKIILNSYPDIFEDRTEVDLKDKWRNMTRH